MNLDTRVNRITGQLQGILRMVREERDPESILQQISAIKSAIDGITREIVTEYVGEKVQKGSRDKVEKIISRAIAL